MTEASPTIAAPNAPSRSGVGYAASAAASAAALLFLPTMLVGLTMSVIASVLGGDVVAWVSSVDMTYTFIGIPALVGLALMFIPYRLFRAAERRMGLRWAVRLAGGLLVVSNAATALLWVREASDASASSTPPPEVWYALAFGIAALAALIATVALDLRKGAAAGMVVAALAGGAVVLGVMLVAVWGSPPKIPIGAQAVRIVVEGDEVRLDPSTVRAGDVYFVTDAGTDAGGHRDVAFVSAGYGSQCPPCATPLPMSDEAVARLAEGDYQGTAVEGGWGGYARFAWLEGKYAFVIASSEGEAQGIPPDSIAVL